jgi:cytochrome P450/NADPH-cytochrome P450 reductase
VAERKKSGDGRNDLLDRMLNGRDPKTGQGLSDENIMYQLLTFMIAGRLLCG